MASPSGVYTSHEYADMHLIYGEVHCNARAAARLYAERYPNRRHPGHEVFSRTHNAISEGRIPGERSGGGRPALCDEDTVFSEVETEPSTSVRMIERRTGIPKSTVHEILQRHAFHPYHVQKVQALQPRDYPARVRFCREMLERHRSDPDFFNKIIWSDESACKRDGYSNIHNLHSWQTVNPHEMREGRSQYQFKINLWTGIFNCQILGPVELPPTINSENYLEFLETQLPILLEDVSLELRRTLWYQHDGCPAHYGRQVRTHLDQRYPRRWIGRSGAIEWPPRSPDLNPLDFFYWGCLKDKIYNKTIQNEEHLRQQIFTAAQEISQLNLRKLRREFLKRCRACIRVEGRQFEHLLNFIDI